MSFNTFFIREGGMSDRTGQGSCCREVMWVGIIYLIGMVSEHVEKCCGTV